MQETGFLAQKRHSPTGFTLIVLAHVAALTALALAKAPQFIGPEYGRTTVDSIPIPKEPPPEPEQQEPRTQAPQQSWTLPERPILPPIDDGPVAEWQPPQPPQPPQPWPPRDEPIISRPDPPAPRPTTPQRARANLGSYFSTDDYPAAALRAEAEGTTRFSLTIGTDGRITNCTVTGSSGHSALDGATCRILRSRARYTPARDRNRNPTTGTDRGSVTWRLPAD